MQYKMEVDDYYGRRGWRRSGCGYNSQPMDGYFANGFPGAADAVGASGVNSTNPGYWYPAAAATMAAAAGYPTMGYGYPMVAPMGYFGTASPPPQAEEEDNDSTVNSGELSLGSQIVRKVLEGRKYVDEDEDTDMRKA